ncbi:MAG: serine/threonine-protein kinase [Chloroflexota bacterium]
MTEASSANNRFGPYLVQEKLGGGGMAVVYKALNEETGATIALKVLRASLAEQSGMIERFMQEATIVNRLRHPHVVAVSKYGMLKSRFYLELQYMPGGTLAQRFKKPVEIGPQESVRLLRHVASALDYAHQMGVVHRDLKLENILLDKRGDALLSDFGIARLVDGTRMTATGSVLGTPLYISPEQARGETKMDKRSDLYSMAVIAYLLAVGRFPFNGSTALVILNQHVTEPAPLPSSINPNLPPGLDAVLLKGLSKRPEERYSSADSLVEALARAWSYEEHPTKTRIDLWSDHSGKSIVVPTPLPTTKNADDWVKEATAAAEPHEKIALLKKALDLEPMHSKANRMLFQVEGAKSMRQEKPAPVTVTEEDLAPLKKVVHKKKRGSLFYIGILAFVLSSASASFFVLSFIGSPIAGQITAILSGRQPVNAINGVPVKDIPNVVLTVQPQRTQVLKMGQKIADTLDNGISNEYDLEMDSGSEVNVAVWFASPTANHVSHNVVVLDPSGQSADTACRRDKMFAGDTNVAFNCIVTKSGTWKIRIFGIDGDSTGAYFITADRQ